MKPEIVNYLVELVKTAGFDAVTALRLLENYNKATK